MPGHKAGCTDEKRKKVKEANIYGTKTTTSSVSHTKFS